MVCLLVYIVQMYTIITCIECYISLELHLPHSNKSRVYNSTITCDLSKKNVQTSFFHWNVQYSNEAMTIQTFRCANFAWWFKNLLDQANKYPRLT